MASYKLYFLDRLGHIEQAKEIVCSSDAEALAVLEAEDRYAELWQRDRFMKCSDALIVAAPANAPSDYAHID
jgi:hypothetical protein